MSERKQWAPVREGSLTVAMLRKGVIESRYAGHLTGALVERVRPQFLALLSSERPGVWIADATAVSGYEPAVGLLGAHWIRDFKSAGGKHFLVVVDSTPLRMLATTAGFAAGLKLDVLPTRADALARLGALT